MVRSPARVLLRRRGARCVGNALQASRSTGDRFVPVRDRREESYQPFAEQRENASLQERLQKESARLRQSYSSRIQERRDETIGSKAVCILSSPTRCSERAYEIQHSPSLSSPDPRAHDQAARPRTSPAQSPTGARPFSRPGSRRTPRPCASCSPCRRARRLLLAGALGARAPRSVSAGGGSVSGGARCGSRGGGAPAQRDDDMLSQR